MSNSDSEEVPQEQEILERQIVVYRPPVTAIVPRYWKFGDRTYCHPELDDQWALRSTSDPDNYPFLSPQEIAEEYRVLDNIISIRRALHSIYKSRYYRGDWGWATTLIAEYTSDYRTFGLVNRDPITPPTYSEATSVQSFSTRHFQHNIFPFREFTPTPTEQYYQIRGRCYWWHRYLYEQQETEDFDIDNDWIPNNVPFII